MATIQAALRRSRVSKITSLLNPPGYRPTVVPQLMMRFVRRSSSSIDAAGGSSRQEQQLSSGGGQNPPDPIPNRPLGAVSHHRGNNSKDFDFEEKITLSSNSHSSVEVELEEDTKDSKPKAEEAVHPEPLAPPQAQDADEIFKKMKETGLIPNAVAMLDGLCKDGLVQEAMKLFGLMRHKGTIPEVVIYTAVVDGFCKAHKLDDAKGIFRKMQNNGIAPNAFSYTVLIQGLCKGKSLDDALDLCVEMLEAGHSPNLATFTGLVGTSFGRFSDIDFLQSLTKLISEHAFVFRVAVKERVATFPKLSRYGSYIRLRKQNVFQMLLLDYVVQAVACSVARGSKMVCENAKGRSFEVSFSGDEANSGVLIFEVVVVVVEAVVAAGWSWRILD
ncbi:hypothetical protein RJ639_046414 [Escallonia herrerae]|uniref:Pentatricopeptide repeat-containing protein n=1 Tax=Escallonia herrerae TaxID=1293975 RepID=A0AA88W8E2_9ASTE|nr:hypothetical protein RJ639_046414 [Escallonia herrerae]